MYDQICEEYHKFCKRKNYDVIWKELTDEELIDVKEYIHKESSRLEFNIIHI